MSFTDVFGGSTVQPSEVRYNRITLTSNISLFWPQQGIDTSQVIARWNDVNAQAVFSISIPSATTVSPGQDAVFNNISASAFSILASDGSTLANVIPGQAIVMTLADNTTDAGSWRIVTFGAGSSQAQASSLAGAGLMASAAVLNLNIPVTAIGATYTTQASDRATLISWTGGAGTITLANPNGAGFGNGWLAEFANNGGGALTLSPASGTIDGNSTKTLNATESCIVHTDGLNYFTVGYGRSVVSSFTRLVVSVAGSTDVTLTSSQAQNQIIECTGALTGNINVIVPAAVARYYFYNNTTGSHTLTFKASGGTGLVMVQGNRQIVHCDGTNIVLSNTAGVGTVTAITAGTGLTGGTITSSGTIAIANTAVTPGSYTSANITIGADGRITSAANGSGGSVTSVTAGNGLTGGTITTTGTIALPSTGVTPGSYVGGNFTVDTYGRITAASSGSGFLPLTGGTLTGPLGGTSGTFSAGISANGAIISNAYLQCIAGAATCYLTSTGHHQWAMTSNTDNNWYLIDNSTGANPIIAFAGNGGELIGSWTTTSNHTVSGTLSAGAVSTGNGTFSGTVNTNALVNNGASTLVGTISCNAINCTALNTQNNTITAGAINASGNISCPNGVAYTSHGGNIIGFSNSGTTLTFYALGGSSGSWNFTASDERVKTNIGPIIGDPLNDLLDLPLISFDYLPDHGDRHIDIGLSAQKIQAVIPEAVLEDKDRLTIDTFPLLARCIGAIQQLEARVKELEAKLADK